MPEKTRETFYHTPYEDLNFAKEMSQKGVFDRKSEGNHSTIILLFWYVLLQTKPNVKIK